MTKRRNPSRQRLVICAICDAHFQTRHSQGKYCSLECRQEGERKHWRDYGVRNRDSRRILSKRIREQDPIKQQDRHRRYCQSDAGKLASKRNTKEQRRRWPEKYSARLEINKALKRGDLVRQPCRCGAADNVHAHHHDYKKPLDIEWLCAPCHRKEHPRETF